MLCVAMFQYIVIVVFVVVVVVILFCVFR